MGITSVQLHTSDRECTPANDFGFHSRMRFKTGNVTDTPDIHQFFSVKGGQVRCMAVRFGEWNNN